MNLWRTEVDAMQGARCNTVLALQAAGNTAVPLMEARNNNNLLGVT